MQQHTMKLAAEPFAMIKAGKKVIESRLYDEKRRQIELGDEIVFCENDNPEHTISARVVGLLRYASFHNLFKDHNPALFGGESSKFLQNQIKQFYSDADEEKHGVLGIHLELID